MQAHYVYVECKESLPALDLLELLGYYIIHHLTHTVACAVVRVGLL